MQIIPTPHAANQFSHDGPFFFQDIFRISLPGGSLWLTSAAFNTHLTSLFAGKNVQKIAFPSDATSRLNTESATIYD